MVTLLDVLRFIAPAGEPGSDYKTADRGVGPFISFWNTAKLGPQPTQTEINAATPAAQAAADAEAADLVAYEADKAALKSGLSAAATRLQAIRDNASPNNAQVIAAVRDLANFQLQTIKALRRML